MLQTHSTSHRVGLRALHLSHERVGSYPQTRHDPLDPISAWDFKPRAVTVGKSWKEIGAASLLLAPMNLFINGSGFIEGLIHIWLPVPTASPSLSYRQWQCWSIPVVRTFVCGRVGALANLAIWGQGHRQISSGAEGWFGSGGFQDGIECCQIVAVFGR